ncbi:MAG: hypothetical protein IJA44_05995 [Clostridia bacterium]|nr:hypothetical protein [Clostridia bacterium]
MNPSTYIPIIFLLIIIFVMLRNRKAVVARKIIKKRKMEGNTNMKELAKRFIDKECLITAFDSNHQFEGVIKEVSDNAILVEKKESVEAINLDFVIRIREYPRNKKGKKKSVVLD